jgi:hypothetical protein
MSSASINWFSDFVFAFTIPNNGKMYLKYSRSIWHSLSSGQQVIFSISIAKIQGSVRS